MPQDGYNVTILRLSCFLIVASDLRCILEGQMIVCHPVAELHLYCLNMIRDLAAKSSQSISFIGHSVGNKPKVVVNLIEPLLYIR